MSNAKILSQILEDLSRMYPNDNLVRLAIWEARRMEGELADVIEELNDLYCQIENKP